MGRDTATRMEPSADVRPLHLLVVSRAEAAVQAEAVVRACCPAPDVVQTVSHRAVSAHRGVSALHGAAVPDAVILWWDQEAAALHQAGMLPTALAEAFASRTATPPLQASRSSVTPPLIALCVGGAELQAAALRAGADAAAALPLSPDLVRAQVLAYHRSRLRAGLADAGRAESGALALPSASRETLSQTPGPSPDPPSDFQLDLRARTLLVDGEPVHLTLKEFDLLAFFDARPGQCCSREEILEAVWGIEFETGTNTVDVFVYALRKKLRRAGLAGVIQTVRGAGYRFSALDSLNS